MVDETTSGMTAVQGAVDFTAGRVLKPEALPFTGTALPMVEQASGMMIEDLRAYIQSSEALLVTAAGQAMKLLLDPATQPTGTAALEALATFQTSLTTYASGVGKTAGEILKDFE